MNIFSNLLKSLGVGGNSPSENSFGSMRDNRELNKLIQNAVNQENTKHPDLTPFLDTSKSIQDEKKKLQEDERRREQERIERLNKSKNTQSFSPSP